MRAWELDDIRRRHADVPELIKEIERLKNICMVQKNKLAVLLTKKSSLFNQRYKAIFEVVKALDHAAD